MTPVRPFARLAVRDGLACEGERTLPEEVAVSLVYDGTAHAVLMATPADLEDFAVGFSLTEGLIADPAEIEAFEAVEHDAGLELRLWLAADCGMPLAARRRRLAGPTGCGLCGIESLDEAMRVPRRLGASVPIEAAEIAKALAALGPAQVLGRQTRAVHAAAFWRPGRQGQALGRGLVALREDVGRHNALDKLAGALARAGEQDGEGAASGLVLLTSRVSVEMVQKTAAIGAPVLVAVSAPTALAVRTAEAAGIALVAVARDDGFEVFCHPERLVLPAGPAGPSRVVSGVVSGGSRTLLPQPLP